MKKKKAYEEVTLTTLPKPTGIKAIGSQVVFELLSEKELVDTKLFLPETKNVEAAAQAILTELGPKVDPNWGFSVGDRVIITGTYTPMPITSKNGRLLGVAESYTIKAVLK